MASEADPEASVERMLVRAVVEVLPAWVVSAVEAAVAVALVVEVVAAAVVVVAAVAEDGNSSLLDIISTTHGSGWTGDRHL